MDIDIILDPACTPAQAAGGCGGRQRNGPTGGAANGMPLNVSTPSWRTPCRRPKAVSITGFGEDIGLMHKIPSRLRTA